jgi:hypothetical protein
MAGPDVRVEALGQAWTFRFGFAAWCAVEDQYDKPFMEVFARCFPEAAAGDLLDPTVLLQLKLNARISDMRAILYAGLVHHHEDITFRKVAEIVDDIGMGKVGELLKKSLTAGQGAGGKAPGNPRKPPARKG